MMSALKFTLKFLISDDSSQVVSVSAKCKKEHRLNIKD